MAVTIDIMQDWLVFFIKVGLGYIPGVSCFDVVVCWNHVKITRQVFEECSAQKLPCTASSLFLTLFCVVFDIDSTDVNTVISCIFSLSLSLSLGSLQLNLVCLRLAPYWM